MIMNIHNLFNSLVFSVHCWCPGSSPAFQGVYSVTDTGTLYLQGTLVLLVLFIYKVLIITKYFIYLQGVNLFNGVQCSFEIP